MTSPEDAKLAETDATTTLAVGRTRLALERTMMAWLRTSTSLITFGFTIQKVFEIEDKGNSRYDGLLGPSNLGRLMVIAGLVILVLSTLSHRSDLNALKKEYPFISARRSMASWVAAVVAVLGIFAMISVMIRS